MENKNREKAIAAGQNALDSLHQVERSLDTAKKLGIIDIVSTSTFFATLKRGRVNKAKEYIALAKEDLQAFENELRGRGSIENIDLGTDDFFAAAEAAAGEDPFETTSQKRIKQIKEAVGKAIAGVENMLKQLQ